MSAQSEYMQSMEEPLAKYPDGARLEVDGAIVEMQHGQWCVVEIVSDYSLGDIVSAAQLARLYPVPVTR